jgi:hypothetical protein
LLCWYHVGVERKSRSPGSTNLKVSAAVGAAFAVVVAVFFYAGRSDPQAGADSRSGGVLVVREDSHRLGEPGAGDVTLLCSGDSAENANSSTMPGEPRCPVGKDG